MDVNIIVAVDRNCGFGKDGKIPWHFPEDFKRFKEITKGAVCIMGRKTYEDMLQMIKTRKKGKAKKAKIKSILPDRVCYVVTSSRCELEGATPIVSIDDGIKNHPNEKVFLLGGERVYEDGLALSNKVYMTVIDDDYNCDRFFPVSQLVDEFSISNGDKYTTGDSTLYFMEYKRNET